MKTAWLLETEIVENGTRMIAYFKHKMLHSGKPDYTFDPNEATQFSSKEDAELHNTSHFHTFVAVEHGWCDV